MRCAKSLVTRVEQQRNFFPMRKHVLIRPRGLVWAAFANGHELSIQGHREPATAASVQSDTGFSQSAQDAKR